MDDDQKEELLDTLKRAIHQASRSFPGKLATQTEYIVRQVEDYIDLEFDL